MNVSLRLSNWLWRDAKWLVIEPGKIWFAFGVPVVVTVAAVLFLEFPMASRFAIAGMVLQLFGIGTVAWGLHDTRKFFSHPKFRDLAIAWLRRRPNWSGDVQVTIAGLAATISAGSKVSAVGRVSLAPDAPLERRVAALEVEVAQISESLHHTRHEIEDEIQARRSADDIENRRRQSEDERIRQQLAEAVAGGLHLEMTGVLWLFVGVILSSVPSL